MALPETILVKFTEEDAGYVTVRPVVRQTFCIAELVDMILGVTGKDVARIQKILRSGTIVFHFYRYWWPGFEAGEEELRAILARFPDPDPGRAFRPEECTGVWLEPAASLGRPAWEFTRADASRKKLFRSQSYWGWLMQLAASRPAAYQGYSYARGADLYALELPADQWAAVVEQARRLAPRALRTQLRNLAVTGRIVLVCPRKPE